jgi:hypothetical protein
VLHELRGLRLQVRLKPLPHLQRNPAPGLGGASAALLLGQWTCRLASGQCIPLRDGGPVTAGSGMQWQSQRGHGSSSQAVVAPGQAHLNAAPYEPWFSGVTAGSRQNSFSRASVPGWMLTCPLRTPSCAQRRNDLDNSREARARHALTLNCCKRGHDAARQMVEGSDSTAALIHLQHVAQRAAGHWRSRSQSVGLAVDEPRGRWRQVFGFINLVPLILVVGVSYGDKVVRSKHHVRAMNCRLLYWISVLAAQ